MEISDFEQLTAAAKSEHPQWFLVFNGLVARQVDVSNAEEQLGARLPTKYKWFMENYGGGAFAFTDILPVVMPDESGESVISVNAENTWSEPFIAVAPVGTGDWWGFLVKSGECSDEVHMHDHEDGTISLQADDFLEFAAKHSLRA
jgi:antitoxin YobK